MAKKKASTRATRKAAIAKQSPEQLLKKYEEIFEQIATFTDSIADAEAELKEAREEVDKAKAALEDAKEKLHEIERSRDGARASLLRFITPTNDGEFMPLFDSMEEPDEEIHGKNCTEWRKAPIAELRLSVPAFNALTEADIVLVGQLQDRVLKGVSWFEDLGLTVGMASAIADRLNDFIFERTK